MKAHTSNLWAVLGVFPAAVGFYLVGWLGVGIAGLLIAFIAVRMDVEIDGPVGSQNTPELYAALRRHDPRAGAENAARYAERTDARRLLRVAKVTGAVMISIGVVGFFAVQLRG